MSPTILLTNDDGVDAPGILVLAHALAELGEVHLCAPLENQSGVGSGLTIGRLVDFRPQTPTPDGVPRMAVNGTPVDAVAHGLREWLAHKQPDLVVSGINLGANIGRNVRYSGTVGAAYEAAWSGIPCLAVSVDYREPPVWDAAVHYARRVVRTLLENKDAPALQGPRSPYLLNLNVPALPVAEVKGLRLSGMGGSGYVDFLVVETPDGGRDIEATMSHHDPKDADLDGALLHRNYASLTPLSLDWTDAARLRALKASGLFAE